jgi:hypothetical protein
MRTESDDAVAAPVRLPGMGGAQSPFKALEQQASSTESGVLAPLTAGRAKGPAKRSRTSASAASTAPAVQPTAAPASQPAAEPAPISHFVGSVPADTDPSVSKLIGSGQDTYGRIVPSDRMDTERSKMSVREVEAGLRSGVKELGSVRATGGKSIAVLISGNGETASCDGIDSG